MGECIGITGKNDGTPCIWYGEGNGYMIGGDGGLGIVSADVGVDTALATPSPLLSNESKSNSAEGVSMSLACSSANFCWTLYMLKEPEPIHLVGTTGS
mmetsp:Transcript_24393/g.39580  ORF Transcript_24393/g.39580 Transcript_24393/m.39580 type:complete len:98 (-) Transcript_24393:2816-3109(-)